MYPEVLDLGRKEWDKRNPKCTVLRRHGLTVPEFHELLRSQNNRCMICQALFSDNLTPHIDHDHECCKGARSCGSCVRGLLCGLCNSGLGFFKENIQSLQRAVEYLKCDERSI